MGYLILYPAQSPLIQNVIKRHWKSKFYKTDVHIIIIRLCFYWSFKGIISCCAFNKTLTFDFFLDHRFLKRDFLKNTNKSLLVLNNLHFKQAPVLHFNNLKAISPKMLCAKFGWKWLIGSDEEDKNVKSLRRRRRRGRQATDKAHVVFRLR